jgi:hypothetical protein
MTIFPSVLLSCCADLVIIIFTRHYLGSSSVVSFVLLQVTFSALRYPVRLCRICNGILCMISNESMQKDQHGLITFLSPAAAAATSATLSLVSIIQAVEGVPICHLSNRYLPSWG